MLTAIVSALGGNLVNGLIDRLTKPFEMYLNKQISIEELRTQVLKQMLTTFAEVEKSHAETLAKTYASFMQAAEKSLLMKVVWASATLSQLFVLLWHQMGIPAVVYFTGHGYPSSGSTVEWAYALLAACLGMGPVVLRTGPGSNLLDKLKGSIGK